MVATPEELYRRALAATNPQVRAAILRAWHRAKTRPGGDAAPPADTPPSRYADLCRAIRTCTACPLARTRTQAVPGEGPMPADVMFIGEGPGEQEDRQGRPFVGPAGRLLDRLLDSAGLRREDVYVANVVACRPPGNRPPEPAEIDACRTHVYEQLYLVRPRVVVTLGGTALGLFALDKRISDCHGRLFRAGTFWVFPSYHPAAALHKPELRQAVLADFRRLSAFVRGILAARDRGDRELRRISDELVRGRVRVEIASAAVGAPVWIVPRRTGLPRYEVTGDELREALASGTAGELVDRLRGIEAIRRAVNGTLLVFESPET